VSPSLITVGFGSSFQLLNRGFCFAVMVLVEEVEEEEEKEEEEGKAAAAVEVVAGVLLAELTQPKPNAPTECASVVVTHLAERSYDLDVGSGMERKDTRLNAQQCH
jgi:hypothetical protein